MPAISLKQTMRRARRHPLFSLDDLIQPVAFNRTEIEALIPHRGRFLLLDEISGADPQTGRTIAVRTLDLKDPVFCDHFPGTPVYPGVLLLEIMGQLALAAHAIQEGGGTPPASPAPVRVLRIYDALFVRSAGPGERLTVLTEPMLDFGYTIAACGQILSGAGIVATAVFEALILEEEADA